MFKLIIVLTVTKLGVALTYPRVLFLGLFVQYTRKVAISKSVNAEYGNRNKNDSIHTLLNYQKFYLPV